MYAEDQLSTAGERLRGLRYCGRWNASPQIAVTLPALLPCRSVSSPPGPRKQLWIPFPCPLARLACLLSALPAPHTRVRPPSLTFSPPPDAQTGPMTIVLAWPEESGPFPSSALLAAMMQIVHGAEMPDGTAEASRVTYSLRFADYVCVYSCPLHATVCCWLALHVRTLPARKSSDENRDLRLVVAGTN